MSTQLQTTTIVVAVEPNALAEQAVSILLVNALQRKLLVVELAPIPTVIGTIVANVEQPARKESCVRGGTVEQAVQTVRQRYAIKVVSTRPQITTTVEHVAPNAQVVRPV